MSKENPLTSHRIRKSSLALRIRKWDCRNAGQLRIAGGQPSYPELLDDLANRFVQEGGSLKRTIKFTLLVETWQATSAALEQAAKIDLRNRLLLYANLQRRDAEAIRDSLLAISGQLNGKMYGLTVAVNSDTLPGEFEKLRAKLASRGEPKPPSEV